MEALSEYELQRLEHIKRNQEFLARLGLAPLSKNADEVGGKTEVCRRKLHLCTVPSVHLPSRDRKVGSLRSEQTQLKTRNQ